MAGFAEECRDCGSVEIQHIGGCPTCVVCGWSACG